MTLDRMFFEFRYADARGESFSLSSSSEVIAEEENYAAKYARKIISKCKNNGKELPVYLKTGFPKDLKEQVGSCYSDNNEAYAVNIFSDKIYIYGLSLRGLLYGISTLAQLIESGNIREMLIFDYPDKSLRGYRVFTPGRSSFDAFKDMVDMLVYYKYNSIIIEVGGAMEYKRHPEINEEWVKYCEEVQRSPYESRRIQKETHKGWQKNSIHSANGGAGYITQDEMRELLAYCKERGFSVIPEVPTLSHCDYLVRAHRELNERKEDTYPDTYCPSDPRTYELVFDVLDEVADVFEPEYINIGHDECYTLAKCDKCKGKDPVDLYVGDIIKINDHLKAKNIHTIMWGEKLFDNIYLPEKGVLRGFGGTGEPAWDVPRLFGCVGKIPRDVTILHWYWSLCDRKAEQDLIDLGYRLIYGNFQAVRSKDYRKRSENIEGGFVSNWGAFEPEYMQRNGQNYNLTGTARIFWSSTYDTPESDKVIEEVKKELYKKHIESLGDSVIEIIHTTDLERPYKSFYDGYFIVPEDWLIGYHIVTYTDGTTAELPIIYGYNIRSRLGDPSKRRDDSESKATSHTEVLGASYPISRNGELVYKTAYKNPYPEKEIASIYCSPKEGINIEAEYNL